MLHHRLLLAAEGVVAIDALEHVERIGDLSIEQGGEGTGGICLNHDLHFLPPFWPSTGPSATTRPTTFAFTHNVLVLFEFQGQVVRKL